MEAMPDYNIGRAHGTVRIDYDESGSGAKEATKDTEKLGKASEDTSKKIDKSTKSSKEDFEALAESARRASDSLDMDHSSVDEMAASIKRLEKDVTDASTSARVARERLQVAEENLRSTRERNGVTAKEVADAERAVQQAQQSTVNAVSRLTNSTKALENARKRLNSVPTPRQDDVDNNQLLEFLRHLRQIQQNTARSSSVLNTFSGRLRLIITGVAIATPGIAGLGVSLAALAGLAGIAAGALAGLGAVAGTVATGMSGIGEAFKASAQASKAAGGAAASSAEAQKAAARAIEDAKRSLTKAEDNLRRVQEDAAKAAVEAAKQVRDAHRDLIDAQRDAIRAQLDLNKARRQAARDLEDMRDALRGGALDERQAVLDLKEAQEELAAVRADPTANADDIAQATLNYDKAVFALQRLQKENQRLTTDQQEAAAAGVSGSDQVVSAQDSVRNAMDSVREAQEGLAEAQENVRQTQVDSARAVAEASEAVIDAQRNLADAYEAAAEAGAAGGGAADKFAEAMANLSPNAQAFVREVLALEGAWTQLRKNVQDELFAGLAQEVAPLARIWFPLLESGMKDVARGLNGMVQETVAYLKTAEAQQNVTTIFNNTGNAMVELRGIVRDLVAAFLDIAAVSSDFLPDMAANAANAAARFREFINAAKESGELRQWMQDAMEATSQLWQLLKNLGGIIATVFTGLDTAGGGALERLTELTGQVEKFLKSAEGQEALHSLGEILSSIGGAYGKVFLSFLDVAASVLIALKPLIIAFADAAGNYLAVGLQILKPILEGIATVLGFLGPAIGPVIAGMYAANKAVDAAKFAWGALNVVMKANPFILIASVIIALALLIIQNWDEISAAIAEDWAWIQQKAEEIWTAISEFFTGIITNIVTGIREDWNAITSFLSEKWESIRSTAVELWTRLDNFFKGVGQRISDGFKKTIGFIIDTARSLPGKVIDFLKSLPGKLANWAGDLINGVVRGLGDMAYKIWQKLKSIVSNAWDSVLDFFGISSPSRLAAEAGEYIMIGLANGIETAGTAAVAAAASMAAAVGNELTGASSTLASSVNLAANTSGLPSTLAMEAVLSGAASGVIGQATNGEAAAGARTVHIENVTLQVAGNLDPTNPTAFRQTIVRLKTAIQNVEQEYR